MGSDAKQITNNNDGEGSHRLVLRMKGKYVQNMVKLKDRGPMKRLEDRVTLLVQ